MKTQLSNKTTRTGTIGIGIPTDRVPFGRLGCTSVIYQVVFTAVEDGRSSKGTLPITKCLRVVELISILSMDATTETFPRVTRSEQTSINLDCNELSSIVDAGLVWWIWCAYEGDQNEDVFAIR